MTSVLNDAKLESILSRLHAQSDAQIAEKNAYFATRRMTGSVDPKHFDSDAHRFLSDKLVALDRDKGAFCYQLCRALRAARIVEAGTSFGVSTLYLAAAVRDNQVQDGVVIGTEYEPNKAAAARANFKEAGLESFIELREGDLRETLKNFDAPVDLMLIDIWEVALPALELISPCLHQGAVVLCDNTADDDEYYHDYFKFIRNPRNLFRTMTVPFAGGFELTVRI